MQVMFSISAVIESPEKNVKEQNSTWYQATTDTPGHKSELVIGVTIKVTKK